MSKQDITLSDVFALLHEKLAFEYIRKLREHDMSPQDCSNLIKLLKDNGITVELKGSKLVDEALNGGFTTDDEDILKDFNKTKVVAMPRGI